MDTVIKIMINSLVGQQLRYSIKSPDMDLFDLGFGQAITFVNANNVQQEACQHTIHLVCGLFIFWKNGRKEEFHGNSLASVFNNNTQPLIGETVRRVALSDKNDLWLDLGQCHIVIVTLDDGEESWRLFTPGANTPHLIATNISLCLE